MSKLVSILLAISFSFLLFVGMTLLIEPNSVKAAPAVKTAPVVIHYLEKDDKLGLIDRKIPEKTKPKKKPPMVKTTIDTDSKKQKVAMVDLRLPNIKGHGIDGINFPKLMGGSDMGAGAPRVRIDPAYPRIAATNNIEGFVTLIYDITPMGTIENIRVVEANPRGIFERNAKRALRKWKYSPKMVDNIPVGIFGESVTLQFRLEQEFL